MHVEEESNQIQIPQFPHNETFESANYRFNPVIENTEDDLYTEDSAFELTDIPSNFFITNLSHCQLDDTQDALLWRTRNDHQDHLGNSNTYTEVFFDFIHL